MQDEGEVSPEREREWTQALLKIRHKDPSIYDPSTKLFHGPDVSSGDTASGSDEEQDDGAEEATAQDPASKKGKKHKKKLLRDVLYEQVLSAMSHLSRVLGTEGSESEEVPGRTSAGSRGVRFHACELVRPLLLLLLSVRLWSACGFGGVWPGSMHAVALTYELPRCSHHNSFFSVAQSQPRVTSCCRFFSNLPCK
jgi:hypothetical protein